MKLDQPSTQGGRVMLELVLLRGVLLLSLLLFASGVEARPGALVLDGKAAGFRLVASGRVATVVYDAGDATVVRHAAQDLAGDLSAVAGVPATAITDLHAAAGPPVIVGTLGKNALIDQLVATRKLDVARLRGAWESFVIATVERPAPGIAQALVIVGSDRRGTAYGVYELSEAMGVSPWSWWADVTPQHHSVLTVPAGTRRFGPPSVRYRGIFINDEDWGLFPWASRTFDPERGNFGPRTYERIFELLLRLKANTLWPAMHHTSTPFNTDPADAKLADDYGIVMGSSHAEPMLRDNVGEWTAPAADFNYATNPTGVAAYWEDRVRASARYESLWTLGMRGIHDSGMVGATTTADRVRLLDRVITDQRAMLRRHVDPDLSHVPQMFVPYKEVLDVYRGGLTVPGDVTIVWPDDNYGYIRQFPSEAERGRPGGSGVYYHLSYLGAPLAYLWLYTTPPALVQEEMTRAWDRGMRTVWIANVGDIKPGEIGISRFLDLAWDIDRWRGASQRAWLNDWAARTFSASEGPAIGALLDAYFRLNYERRPEHLDPARGGRGWGGFTPAEADARLRRFGALVAAVAAEEPHIPAPLRDAWFELVAYPVRAAAAANERFFATQRYAMLIDRDPAMARSAGAAAIAADRTIKALTLRFNEDVAGGKWRHIIAEEPADPQWPQFRTAPLALPAPGLTADPAAFRAAVARADPEPSGATVQAEAGRYDGEWRLVESLGRGEGALIAKAPGARLSIDITVPAGSTRELQIGLLPFFPDTGDRTLHLAVTIDSGSSREIVVPREAETATWSTGVLDNLLRIPAGMLTPGRHRVTLVARGSGVAVDQISLAADVAKNSAN